MGVRDLEDGKKGGGRKGRAAHREKMTLLQAGNREVWA